MSEKPTIHVFGVPMDLGQQRRGVDMGPSAVRYAELQDRVSELGYPVHDHGNIHVPTVEQVRKLEKNAPEPANAHHLSAVVQVCQTTYTRVADSVPPGDLAICLGGDHSIAIGTVSATAKRGPCGLIWVDAHADFNIPECSPSGNIHGMALAGVLGDGPAELTRISAENRLMPSQVVMIGLRSVDPQERERLRRSEIRAYTMTDIDEYGIAAIARQTLERLRPWGGIHVSLDMDALDPDVAPGVGTPVRGGLTYREAHLLMELLAESELVRSLDIVEVNPILDNHNQTAELGVELAVSLFGSRIL